MESAFKGKTSIKVPSDTKMIKMVVVGCPNDEYKPMTWNNKENRTYNYKVTVK